MPVSTKQFHYLSEMEIPLWQNKETSVKKELNTPDAINININELAKNTCFTDILSSLNLTVADCKLTSDMLIFDFFNWQFSHSAEINIEHNCLTTPPIAKLSTEPKLKKQLWSLLSTQLVEQ